MKNILGAPIVNNINSLHQIDNKIIEKNILLKENTSIIDENIKNLNVPNNNLNNNQNNNENNNNNPKENFFFENNLSTSTSLSTNSLISSKIGIILLYIYNYYFLKKSLNN